MTRLHESGIKAAIRRLIQRTHVSPDCLEEYTMGRLTPEKTADIEEHLLICQCCRRRLVKAEETIRLIREVFAAEQTKLERSKI